METEKSRFKQWREDHHEAIATVAVVGTYIAAFGGLIAYAAHYKKKTQRKLQDAHDRGAHVLMPGDGSFWIVEHNNPFNAEVG